MSPSIRLLVIAGVAALLTQPSAAAPQPLNVVFILADDLGWSDCTLQGTTKLYQTPNIARLAARGMTFSRAYTNSPLCSPTRASLLTGLSVARHGITAPVGHTPQVILKATIPEKARPDLKTIIPDSVSRLQTDYHTLGEAFQQSGYATGHFGKWHLGTPPYSPLQHGFDVDLPHDSGPGPKRGFVGVWNYPKLKPNHPQEHIEDRMAEEAVKFIGSNKDRPFFLNYWQFSVHAPFDAKKELIEKYRGLVKPGEAQRSPTYAAMVESMDDAVGTLLDALDRNGLTDRTVIVFYSDNGGNMYNQIDGTTPTCNAPLRGGKATLWEGGIRVPCVIAWPQITTAGSRSDALIQTSDFFPTFADLLKIKTTPGQHFDGTTIAPALKGGKPEREAVFVYFPHSPQVPDTLPPGIAVITSEWKLIRLFNDGANGTHRHLLFNLKDDMGETKDLSREQPERVRELDALIENHLSKTKAVIPATNPNYHPRSAQGDWSTSKDCTLDITDRGLILKTGSNDPWAAISVNAGKLQGPFTVSFRMKSTGSGPGQVMWRESAKQPFNGPERSTTFTPIHDSGLHDYKVALPAGKLAAIRIDPGNSSGEFSIENLQVTAGGTAILTWPEPAKP